MRWWRADKPKGMDTRDRHHEQRQGGSKVWNDVPADALTEAAERVDVARLQALGFVVQHHDNGTVTFWQRSPAPQLMTPSRRNAIIQQLIAAGALRDGE